MIIHKTLIIKYVMSLHELLLFKYTVYDGIYPGLRYILASFFHVLSLPQQGMWPEGRSWHTLTKISDSLLFLYGGFNQNNQPLSMIHIL